MVGKLLGRVEFDTFPVNEGDEVTMRFKLSFKDDGSVEKFTILQLTSQLALFWGVENETY
jgi:hypothetical protein